MVARNFARLVGLDMSRGEVAEGNARRCQNATRTPATDGKQLGILAWRAWTFCVRVQPQVVPFLLFLLVCQQHPSLLEDHQDQRHQQCLEHQLHQLHPGIKTM